MGTVLLSNEDREKNTSEGIKWMFLDTLDQKGWQEFLSGFNHKVERKMNMDEFKVDLWDTVLRFGEPVLMATGLNEKAREELLDKMINMRETNQSKNPAKIALPALTILIYLTLEKGEARVSWGRSG